MSWKHAKSASPAGRWLLPWSKWVLSVYDIPWYTMIRDTRFTFYWSLCENLHMFIPHNFVFPHTALELNGVLSSLMICWLLLVPIGVLVLVSLLLSSFFPQERGSVPSWFAGSSWFRLGFWCLSPFFSVFFPQERGSVPSWFAGSSWFRLGFRCLSPFFSLLWFRCLSCFFSLLSFLRTGVLFHHDLLVPPGSGWGSGACLPSSLFFGSGACLPSSLFFLSSGRGFCSIMICWFLLVPAGVPVLVSLLLSSLVPVLVLLLLSSFFPQETGSVPSWFAGSSWFRLGFRCLSPFFSLLSFFLQESGSVPSWFAGSSWFRLVFRCLSPFLSLFSFLRKGVLFHHDLLVSLGSGWGSGACLPSSLFFGSGACLASSLFFLSSGKGFCSIMICWFFLVPAGVPVLVSLGQNSCHEEMALRKCKILSNFFKPQNQSNGFKHAHAALKHHLNQTKIDIFFSAVFWDKFRGHFRMLKSQNISHALCAHFSWLRTARWDEKSGWWRCPKLDAKTLPNSQQPKRKKTQHVSKKANCLNCKF